MSLFRFSLAVLLSATACAASAQLTVVPGKSLGGISLGMSERTVRAKLKTPNRFAKGADGLVVEYWFGKKRSGTGSDSYLRRNYVAVYIVDDRVAQIEATSKSFKAVKDLTTATPVTKWETAFPKFKSATVVEVCIDPEMLPACKHLLFFGDAISVGLAWKQGTWGCLWPEPGASDGLESVIVHKPGKALISNPNDSQPYAGT